MMRVRTAVLASGSGTNLQAILDHLAALGDLARAEVVLVASDREGAGALERARASRIATHVIADPDDPSEILALLQTHAVELVVLAGYVRLLPAAVIERFPRRVVNVHPAPLPQFGGRGMYGRRVHEAVLAAGLEESAVSIHLVNEEFDRGPVIASWPVRVLPGDDAAVLAARVLAAEHVVYPRAVDTLAHLISIERERR